MADTEAKVLPGALNDIDPDDIDVDPTGVLRLAGSIAGSHHSTSAADHAAMTERGYLPDWSPFRIWLAIMFNSDTSDKILSVIVLFNLVIVVLETDMNVEGGESKSWVSLSNTMLLVFYMFEVTLRIFTFRKWFFTSRMNLFDLFIVSLDLVMSLLEWTFGHMLSLTFLRIFRLTRLRRSVNVMMLNPELSLLIRGLKDTGKTLFWGLMLILVMLLMWSLIAVQFIHPVNLEVAALGKYDECERCPRAFSSVLQASLTFYQHVVVGDAWSEVTMPVIEHSPATAVFFVLVHLSVNIGLMNLLLAVIVERANEARNEDIRELARDEKKSKDRLRKRLHRVFADMDKDEDQLLSLEEVKQGYRDNPEFSQALTAMDVEEADLDTIYEILEGAGTEGVQFNEFVDHLFKLKSEDQHTMLIFIKFYITDVRNKLDQLFSNNASNISGFISDCGQPKLEKLVSAESKLQQTTLLTPVIDGADVQEIISCVKGSIYQELRPLQCFAGEISALLRQAFLELAPQESCQPMKVGLADPIQQDAPQIQASDEAVAVRREAQILQDNLSSFGDIDAMAVAAAGESPGSFAGAAPVPVAGRQLGRLLYSMSLHTASSN